MLITDGTLTPSNFVNHRSVLLETVEFAVAAGIELIQVREKQLPGRLLFELVRDAGLVTAGSGTRLLVNERFEIALASGADGVHLTSTSIPVDRVRSSTPSGFLIGVSVHTYDEAAAAKKGEADYAMIGPIFATPGKGEPFGIDQLRDLSAAVDPFPLIAVGGIDDLNYQSVLDAGAAGFAAIRYLNDFVKISQ